jgi:hypothetical protein
MAEEIGYEYNMGFYAMLADVVTMSCISLSANVGLANFYLAFCCYLHHQFFNGLGLKA